MESILLDEEGNEVIWRVQAGELERKSFGIISEGDGD